MRAKWFVVDACLATVAAGVMAWYAVGSCCACVSGICATDIKSAELIRERCPLHLVQPDWVKGSDEFDVLFRWSELETKARVVLVGALWVGALGGLAYRELR